MPVLSDTNYSVWSYKLQVVLTGKGLWNVVELGLDEASDVKEESKDAKAHALIVEHIEDKQVIHVKSCKTTKHVWDTLQKLHESTMESRRYNLVEDLRQLKMKEGGQAREHCRRFENLSAEIEKIDGAINRSYKQDLLYSLPKSFESFVVAHLSRCSEMEVVELHAAIHNEQLRQDRSLKDERQNTTNTALAVLHCDYCGIDGHKMEDCRKRRRANIVCNYCKIRGHKFRFCRKRISDEKKANYSDNGNKRSTPSGRALMTSVATSEDLWYLDSGSFRHMSGNRSLFTDDLLDVDPSKVVGVGGQELQGNSIGTIHARFQEKDYSITALYVPGLKANILSIAELARKGLQTRFEGQQCIVADSQNGEIEFYGELLDSGIYGVRSLTSVNTLCSAQGERDKETKEESTQDSIQGKWHRLLGHAGSRAVYDFLRDQKIYVEDFQWNDKCNICLKAKMPRKSFPAIKERQSKNPLELIHSDLCGPMPVNSLQKRRYWALFIDDCTRYTWIYFLYRKSDVGKAFEAYVNFVQNQFDRRIKSVRTDDGKEYRTSVMKQVLRNQGIDHQVTARYTPQQNGVAERANRTVMEKTRSLLLDSQLPKVFWQSAALFAVHVKNITPYRRLLSSSPYEALHGRKPNVDNIKPFGCLAYVQIPRKLRSKLDDTARQMAFMGYTYNTDKVLQFYDPKAGRFIQGETAEFFPDERCSMKDHEAEGQTHQVLSTAPDEESEDDNDESTPIEAPLDEEATSETEGDNATGSEEEAEEVSTTSVSGMTGDTVTTDESYSAATTGTPSIEESSSNSLLTEPSTFQEAVRHNDRENWKLAMEAELRSIKEHHVYDLVDLPKNRKVLGTKWVYRIKRSPEGYPLKYKARYVAQGFSQKEGVDYNETYAPVAKLATIRRILSEAVQSNWWLHTVDIDTAFLNGTINEEVYVKQPAGYEDTKHPTRIWRLRKALYGLKQSPRVWYHTIDSVLREMGLKSSKADKGYYVGIIQEEIVRIGLYVDDLLIAATKLEAINTVKQGLSTHFNLKDLGETTDFLGTRIEYDRNAGELRLSQEKLIDDLIKQYSLNEAKPVDTPLPIGYHIIPKAPEDEAVDRSTYQSLIGSLLYLALSTRPDITYAVNTLSRRNSDPSTEHFRLATRVIRYLMGTRNLKLLYRRRNSSSTLTAYTDSDFAGDKDRKSVSGLCVFSGGNLLSWKTQKQGLVALSTAEAELIALCTTAQEALWIKKLGYKRIVIYCDNKPTIAVANSQGNLNRIKHVEIKYLAVQDFIDNGRLEVRYISTHDNVADIFTKSTTATQFQKLRGLLGLV